MANNVITLVFPHFVSIYPEDSHEEGWLVCVAKGKKLLP
jgi:hypothetical protein